MLNIELNGIQVQALNSIVQPCDVRVVGGVCIDPFLNRRHQEAFALAVLEDLAKVQLGFT